MLKTLQPLKTLCAKYARFSPAIHNLAACVPAVASWSLARLPAFLRPEQTQRVLDQCERQTALGRRDYAMLSLFARLGLRAGEVASLGDFCQKSYQLARLFARLLCCAKGYIARLCAPLRALQADENPAQSCHDR
jgi:site-specific recombinase XerC